MIPSAPTVAAASAPNTSAASAPSTTATPKKKFASRTAAKAKVKKQNEIQATLVAEEEAEAENYYTIVEHHLPFLIHVLANFNLVWEVILYVVIVTNYLLLTYGSFFTFFNEGLWDIIFVTDCLYAIDVIMRLGVEMWRNVAQTNLIVFTSPYRFSFCFLDLLSLFPLYVIIGAFSNYNSLSHLSTLDFYRLNSFIRLYRAILFFVNLEKLQLLSEEVLFVMRFSNVYLVFINLVSCIFFSLTGVAPIDFLLWRNLANLGGSWAKDFKTKKPEYGQEPWDLYILSTHFSTATVTTVGYGDVHGETELEMFVCIVIMLFGAIFLNGYFTSQITNFQLELDGARYDLFFRLDGINNYLTEVGMTPFFQSKVELYYKCLWTYREGVDRVSFIDLLPRSFQEDMYFDVCTEMFHKSYLFRDLDEAFLRAVSRIVKIALYNPDMILCRYGGYANQMYYILQGECQAMSKYESSKRAAILRAGSIIGEMNLFFSCPYTISVETNTCCQFISIDKEELMACFNKFPVELSILRTRSQTKINQMYKYYQLYGKDPICWVQQRDTTDDAGNPVAVPPPNCTARWGDYLNAPVLEDVIFDVDRFVIFETPCLNPKFKKNHVTPYMTCVVPEILNWEQNWVEYWNIAIMVFALANSFIGPYCLAFGSSSQLEHYICQANHGFQYIIMTLFILDVVVEVYGACPVEGVYYRFHDGIGMKCREIMFYFDLLAAAPITPFQSPHEQDTLHIVNVVFKAIKIWKVIRYLKFLDNVYPKDLFWFRLCQTFIVLMYGIHFIACIVFYLACPSADSLFEDQDIQIVCGSDSWIASYRTMAISQQLPIPPEVEPQTLGKESPYLLSFYFSAATLTSAGFGDFNPQNITEIIWTIFFQLIGFFIIGYYTAVLTSALACTVKPRLEFQQKLVAVKRFMQYYSMPNLLLRRVVEHYELQNQLHHGVNLPPGAEHFLFDAPDYIKHDVLYTDVVLILDGIPLFSKTESKNIVKMSEIMKRHLIPPNVKFVHRGEVRRCMYAIRYGSVGAFGPTSFQPVSILESTAYFGLRDLLFGEPSHHDHKTLSYCLLYEISYSDFLNVFEDDEELMDHLNSYRGEKRAEVEEMCKTYSHIDRQMRKDRSIENPSWILFTPPTDTIDKISAMRYKEYSDYFNEFPGSRFWKFFLMNGTVQPVGLFAKLWTSWMSLASCLTICFLMVESLTYFRTTTFRTVQWMLDLFFFVDIYVRLHWGYYLSNGLLVSHPLKTAGLYFFEGTFFMDIIFCAPVEQLMWFLGVTSFFGYGKGASWFTKLRWIRFYQIKRVPEIFKIIHTIFYWRNAVLFLLYVTMTMMVCTIVASIALYIGCPWEANNWTEGDENRLPFCLEHTWASTKFGGYGSTSLDVLAVFKQRWVVGVYYVCQVILVIGFGDMITLQRAEVTLLIFMSVFGFIFMRCVIADITAAEVDSDEIRSKYGDQMDRLAHIMTRENVNKRLITNVKEHLNYTWKKSRGLQPRELFRDLHAALESDLYRSYVGDKLKKVPIFRDFAPNILRSLCQYVKKLYCLKGDRLARFGNLESEMYIIISGKVWITDRLLNYGCTLHKNESFGETAIISHSPRRYTVIAATNVEAFVVSYSDFQIIIDRYPTVKTILEARTGNGHYDYFEYKIYDMIEWLKTLSGDDKDRQVDALVGRTLEIKKIVYNREGVPDDDEEAKILIDSKNRSFRDRFFSYGYEDDNLPFIYFALQRSRTTGKLTAWPPLIHPNCVLMRWFLEYIYVLCILYPAVAVYEVCFNENILVAKSKRQMSEKLTYQVSDIVHIISDEMNASLLLYVLLKFITPFQDADGNYVKNSFNIVVNYATSVTGFIIDIIALAAGFSKLFVGHIKDPTTSRYISLFILLWLIRYYANHFSKRDDLSISAFKFKIKVSVSSFCLMAHILACIFYLIAECKGSDPYPCKANETTHAENTWTHQFAEAAGIKSKEDDSMKPWKWWIRSLYWVVTVISTTGFGDITPQNVPEMIIGIICVFSGAFILSIILSNFTAGMASLTKASREYFYQVKLLTKYMRNIGLSSLRQEQINFYFEMAWTSCRGAMYHEAVEILPCTMQIEVCNALFEPVLKQVSFFNINDKCFIRQVSHRVIHSMYLPGVCIVKEGDLGNIMYIVYKGRVSGVGEAADTDTELKSVYKVGDVFGQFPALFHDEWYKKSYRAEEATEVLGLSQYDIVHLASIYKDFWTLLLSYIEQNYDPNGGSDCIFIEPRTKARDLFDLGDDYRKQRRNQKNEREKETIKNKNPEVKKKKKVHISEQKRANIPNPTTVPNVPAATSVHHTPSSAHPSAPVHTISNTRPSHGAEKVTEQDPHKDNPPFEFASYYEPQKTEEVLSKVSKRLATPHRSRSKKPRKVRSRRKTIHHPRNSDPETSKDGERKSLKLSKTKLPKSVRLGEGSDEKIVVPMDDPIQEMYLRGSNEEDKIAEGAAGLSQPAETSTKKKRVKKKRGVKHKEKKPGQKTQTYGNTYARGTSPPSPEHNNSRRIPPESGRSESRHRSRTHSKHRQRKSKSDQWKY